MARWTPPQASILIKQFLGDDAQIAKSGELPLKALVGVDAIRKACLTNLDCVQDPLFAEVKHPVDERPNCNLAVGRGTAG
jgi:hypothetical protein